MNNRKYVMVPLLSTDQVRLTDCEAIDPMPTQTAVTVL